MLTYRLLKNHAGILLCGDYETLKALYEVVHAVNEKSSIIADKDSAFLALAYDIRHAFQGLRKKMPCPEHSPELGPQFGVQILWPVILWQSRVLRTAMGFMDTTKHMQAQVYALESVIELALKDDFGGTIGENAITEWERMDIRSMTADILMSRGPVFCAWSKAQRRSGIVGLLASFSFHYGCFYKIWTEQGAKNLVSPQEFDRWHGAEWPDPRW